MNMRYIFLLIGLCTFSHVQAIEQELFYPIGSYRVEFFETEDTEQYNCTINGLQYIVGYVKGSGIYFMSVTSSTHRAFHMSQAEEQFYRLQEFYQRERQSVTCR